MDERQGVRYWCHSCEEVIDPAPEMKCPGCDGGFVEEMDSEGFERAANTRSDRSLSLLAPLLLGMLGGSRRSRLRREVVDEDDDDDDDDEDSDRELEEFIRRRRRRGSSALARLLQTLRDDIRGLDDNDSDTDRDRERDRARERQRERERERERQRDRGRERTESLILINSNNEAIILQGTFGPDDNNQEESGNTGSGVSLGDYFLGPGLDILLQRLAESDLNRSGTPPAKKEAVDALPTVNIQEVLGCSVCLEDFEMGTEAKEMPCCHKFHSHCILPWLEMHSSCPICRFQLPTEETKNPCESASSAEVVNSDGEDAAAATASGSDHESTSRNGSNHSGRRIFSTLSALFSDSSSSSSDDNAPRSSER